MKNVAACKDSGKNTEPCSVDNSHIEALHSDGTDLYSDNLRIGRILDVGICTESRPFTYTRRDMTISLDIDSGPFIHFEFESGINLELFNFLKDW